MSELPVSTAGDHSHPHPPRTGHRILDLTIAISAIFISVISLVVAIEHGRTEQQLVAANSWPFVIFSQSLQGDVLQKSDKTELKLLNPGVGPANVQSLVVRLDGRVVRDHEMLLERCCGYRSRGFNGDIQAGVYATAEPVGIIPAHDQVLLLGWKQTKRFSKAFDRLTEVGKRLTFEGCYCSVLGQCWDTDLKTRSKPKLVKACTFDPRTYAG